MKRLECFDGLRGVLAVYVMIGHMAPFAILPDWLQLGVSHGGAAVDVFFILSGLVISQSLDRTAGKAWPFLLARAVRIFPVFLPVFAFAVLVQQASCGFDRMPWIGPDNAARTICVMAWPHAWPAEIAAHLTMTHGLFPNAILPDVWVSFLGSAWSLSTEWQFYLLALLVWRSGNGPLSNLLLALAAAGLAWSALAAEHWQFSRAFLPNKAHFFALGVASAGIVRGDQNRLALYALTLAACLIVCAGADSFGKLLPPLLWTLCLAAQIRPRTAGLRLLHAALSSRTARWFGAISFCVYLVNEPIHKLLAAGLSRLAGGNALAFSVLWLPAAAALPVIAALLLHEHIEKPAMRWGRFATSSRPLGAEEVAGGATS